MIKRITSPALLLLMLCLTASAQELGSWHMYLSYHVATKSASGGSIIYSLMNGNLLSYDTEDGEVRTYDPLNALSDVEITHIAYSDAADRLIVVYNNSNVDLLSPDGTVLNLSALKEKNILDKEITDVSICGSMAYLATGFGFVEVDMKEGVFRNTYRLGYAVNCIAASDKYVFIGTDGGIRRCEKASNMQIVDNWKMLLDWGGFKKMAVYQDKLVAMNNGIAFVFDPNNNFSRTTLFEGTYTYLKLTGGQLLWGNAKKMCFTTDVSSPDEKTLQAAVTTIDKDNTWSDVVRMGNTYWMSEQEKGLCAYKITGSDMTATGEAIQPSSPIRDLAYRVRWEGNRLLVAGGINTAGAYTNPATAMYYEDGKWTNFKEMTLPPEYSRMQLINTTDLVQDPLDNTHHYASLYRSGLCEYRNGEFVKLYNHDNSPLRSLLPNSSRYYNYVTCAALSYDVDGNLWMASSMRDSVLHVLKPDGTWYNPFYEDLKAVSLIDHIVHHSSGLKFLVSRRIDKRGLYCIDMKGTERTSDDKIILHQTITNQDGTPYTPESFFCASEDLEGLLWVGTSSGLFVIDDFTKVFNSDFQFTQVKINRNDGSGLADYLLNDVSIACITIDAANRKWIGTQTNGAYLISADGQEMLHHFTVENSPLLSDNVQDIAVNPATGEVVFGTDKGLCSYMSDATTPEQELQKSNVTIYPNPVTPDYNGPVAIRGLVADTEVKIISTGGQLVWNGSSAGGTCLWNGTANNGRRVASGIYHVVANTPEGNKAIVSRIVIVR